MWVIKVGGSLTGDPGLPQWLAALAGHRNAVVVPGGGPFADTVRTSQARWGFDDATAHHMALLAMTQYGLQLCALEPRLCAAADSGAIHRTLEYGRVPVWIPERMAAAEPTLARDWSVTSDSLAAWLADRLGADGLLLIKSAPGPYPETPEALAAAGLVDAAFPRYCRTPMRIAGPADNPNIAITGFRA